MLLAELISAAVETFIYAAAALAVTAAIGLAVAGTAFTGGALGFAIGIAAGAAVGAMSSIPIGEDRSIGDAISDFSDSIGNAIDSPDVYGEIKSGSKNTFINGKPAARAAAVSSPNGSGEEEKGEEPSVLENVSAIAQTALGFAFPPFKLVKDFFDTVHQIFNPPVTTPAAPGFTPKEEDKITCTRHPPMPETYIAQGSDKVQINSRPAARSGDKATCDATIDVNANVSPNVRIGGGTVTVRNIHNGKSKTAQIAGIVAALLISRRMGARPRRSPKAKKNDSIICPLKGRPVLISTGSKILYGAEDVDFSLPGLLGIDWARSYDSNDSRTDGIFGRGWSVPYEVEIARVPHPHGGELWIYVDETGNRLELGQLIAGNAFVSAIDGLAFFPLEDGRTVVEDIYAGRYQVFQSDPHNPQRSRLIRLGDRNLNVLDMLYDEQGRLHFLVDKYSQTVVQLHYDQQHPKRVGKASRVFLKAGENPSIERNKTLASYRYTRSGQLHEVLDATDHVVRRFTYTAEGYLNSHQVASGAVREYEWARFAIPKNRPTPKRADGTGYQLPPLLEPQPDHEWRVTRHWGSDGEEYRFEYDLERGETHVTDNLGRQDHYYWGPFYEIYKHIDPLGNCWQEEIIAGQLMKSVDPQGGEWHYSYDDIGRLTETRDPLGRSEHIRYLRHWALPVEVTDTAGHTYRSRYDAQGNLLWEADPLGRKTHYQYDPEGRVVRITDTLDKTKYLSWNVHGQLLSYRDCSNAQTLYHYDTDGRLCESINARGEHTHYRYDARGYLIESQRPDGRIDRYDIDAAGQLTAYTDPAQRITRLRYDHSGRLIRRIDALGHSVEFGYDAYGRLLHLSNENRERYRFEWDVLDRLLAQQDLDGSGRIYQYNPLDDVTAIHHIPAPNAEPELDGKDSAEPHRPLVHHFERDALGRLIRKRTDDGITEYAYDNADNLLAINFTDIRGDQQRLDYSYDALGQLLSETNSAGLLQYDYDELGNLQTLTLPDQRQLNHLYYGSGHLHQINLGGRVISDFERDQLHDEVLRTQGSLLTRTRYDRSGRLSQKTLHYQQVAREVLPLLQKDYQYDASDNLVAEILTQTQRPGGSRPTTAANDDNLIGRFHNQSSTGKSYQGSAQYGYNPVEQIQSVHRGPSIESLNYDAAGNLFDGYRVNGLIKHNRVHVYQDKRYRYDRFGRLSEKRSGSSRIQHFEYDAEHRLTCIRQQQGSMAQRIVFNYDPLGRRISKQVYNNDASEPNNRILFHWQGLRLLGEVQDGRPSLYVYADPDSYEPLARVDGKPGSEAVFYFHTNLAGLPEQLTDTDGTTVWHSEYLAWGRTRDEWHDQQPGREQNLRFQGQYLDRETGLHYNTFRFFDPDVGRFTQPDPIGLEGGINLYTYAPNPLRHIDPLGWAEIPLDKPGYTTYGLYNPGEKNPYYVGHTGQTMKDRLGEHIYKNRATNGTTIKSLSGNPGSLTYSQSKGYEQAFREHYKTKTGFPGNVIEPVDKNRTDPRAASHLRHYNEMKGRLDSNDPC
ncbi:RHS repeat-associated core domain-containing protein [Pseudomonas sp. MF7453]|uniref:RHS repeat-associated core domain-containing protein n=1 Tax=Pseudomonas sp. MF7453 TaxID=2797539 RepID=UPI002FCD9451